MLDPQPKNGSSVMSVRLRTPASFFRILNMDMVVRRKKKGKGAPAVPVPLSDHIRAPPFRCKCEQRWYSLRSALWHTNLEENIHFGSALCNLWMISYQSIRDLQCIQFIHRHMYAVAFHPVLLRRKEVPQSDLAVCRDFTSQMEVYIYVRRRWRGFDSTFS